MTLLTLTYCAIALGIGWLIGARYLHGKQPDSSKPNSNAQLDSEQRSTRFLANSSISDIALERFIQSLEVSGETLETHLALAALCRQRGEVERATTLHKNLLEREDLTTTQRQLAELELARDYLKAGLHDHAEAGFQRLVEKAEAYRVAALHSLLELYQEDREWTKAIQVATALVDEPKDRLPKNYDKLRSQFYCELAELAIAAEDFLTARRSLSRAASYDLDAPRPPLLLAKLELQLGDMEAALSQIDLLLQKSNLLWEPILALYIDCLSKSEEKQLLVERVIQLHASIPSAKLLLSVFGVISVHRSEHEALDYLVEQVMKTPSITGMDQILKIAPERLEKSEIAKLYGRLAEEHEELREYLCSRCGFEAREHHWACPTCRRWDTMVYNADQSS